MVERIVVDIIERADEIEANVVETLDSLFVELNDAGEKREFRQDWDDPHSYIGKAPLGSAEGAEVWRIFKILVNPNGSVVITKAYPARWTERLTETYT
jgi:hypothetical protein